MSKIHTVINEDESEVNEKIKLIDLTESPNLTHDFKIRCHDILDFKTPDLLATLNSVSCESMPEVSKTILNFKYYCGLIENIGSYALFLYNKDRISFLKNKKFSNFLNETLSFYNTNIDSFVFLIQTLKTINNPNFDKENYIKHYISLNNWNNPLVEVSILLKDIVNEITQIYGWEKWLNMNENKWKQFVTFLTKFIDDNSLFIDNLNSYITLCNSQEFSKNETLQKELHKIENTSTRWYDNYFLNMKSVINTKN